MVDYQLLNTTDFVTTLEKDRIINFLESSLDEYKDSRDNISRAIEYALSKFPHQGGFVLLALKNEEMVGAAVVNRTNFEGYFAENVLVYLAVNAENRRLGIASELIDKTKVYTKGNVMARLVGESPIRELLEKGGFEKSSTEFLLKR